LQDQLTIVVDTNVPGDDDVGAETLVHRMDVHAGVELVSDTHRLVVHEPLVDLDDLHGLHAHVDIPEEIVLDKFREDRHEGYRCDDAVVAQFGGRCLVEAGRVLAFDGTGETADLLAAHDEVVRVPPNHSADIDLERHGLRQFRGRDGPAEDLLATGG